jgi:hypothetical protein
LRPPTTLNSEISPELEQILMTAMERNRDERYEHATLMAQDLRDLRLQAPGHASFGVSSQARPSGPGPRESLVIRPPKRPQAQRPRYIDWEQQPASEPNDLGQGQASNENNHVNASNQQTEHLDTIPTRPLNPEQSSPMIEQATPIPETRRTLWKQLQRIFKAE